MEIIFWISVTLIIYTYIGYPILLTILFAIKRNPADKADIVPSITLIIAAYNEEKAIEAKIKNSLNLDYDKDKLEIIVASDCSTDRTDEIVMKYADKGVRLARLPKRGGKTAAQNWAVAAAQGEILVFSDATTEYLPDCLRKIVRSFNDYNVGCVGGKLVFVQSSSSSVAGKNISEEYDQFVKLKESQIKTMFGVNGCLYAVRRDLYEPIEGNLTSDLVVPLKIIEKGYRVIYEPEAISFEEIEPNLQGELKRKMRTVKVGMTGFFSMAHLLNPFKKSFISWGLLSHKFFRWFLPLFMFLAFLSNLMIITESIIYWLSFSLQVAFYGLALIGYMLSRLGYKVKLLVLPLNFCLLNLAAILGFFRFIREEKTEIWEPVR